MTWRAHLAPCGGGRDQDQQRRHRLEQPAVAQQAQHQEVQRQQRQCQRQAESPGGRIAERAAGQRLAEEGGVGAEQQERADGQQQDQVGQTTGRIEGTAKDQTGGVIPGVTVTLSSATGTKTMITGDSGEFAFPFLVPGKYSIKAELEGFKAFEQDDITVRLGVVSTLNLVLSPGEISEVITVTGEAPLVDTTTTTIGANISDSLYTSIPTRRNFANLFNLAPGVVDS